MTRYVLRRLAYLVPIWLGISFVSFGLASLTPGDPAQLILQQRLARKPTAEEIQQMHDKLGLDDAFLVRYVRWVADAAAGDLGTSYRTGEPVRDVLVNRFPNTLQIALLGTLSAVAIALPLGILAAIWRHSLIDQLSRVLALIGTSMPSYWLAYLLILMFAVRLDLLPVAGRGSWQHLVLPTATLALGGSAGLMRLARSEMLEVLGQDFIRTSRAKGLAQRAVILRHALRNMLIPIVTVIGLRFAGLLGGALIIETIFAWPGIGKLAVDAIFQRDYPMVQGFVVLMGTVFLLANLLVDLTYTWIDPRIRVGRS